MEKGGKMKSCLLRLSRSGAIKLNDQGEQLEEFHRVIRPVVYEKAAFPDAGSGASGCQNPGKRAAFLSGGEGVSGLVREGIPLLYLGN